MTDPRSKAISLLREAQSVAVARHLNPDGDCLGAQLGLGLSLREMGKHVDLISIDDMPRLYGYLPGIDTVCGVDEKAEYDLFVMVDLGDMPRLGDAKLLKDRARASLCVDHHSTTESPCDVNVVRTGASSTCEIIAELLMEGDFPVTPDVATALYAGITTDSNRFLYDTARAHTMRVAADLIDRGANVDEIYFHEFQNIDANLFAYQGEIVGEAEYLHDGKAALAAASLEGLKRRGLPLDAAETVINEMKNIAGVEIAILVKERGENVQKVSFRAKRYYNVAKLATRYGGGGHIKAAGCTLNMSLSEAMNEMRSLLEGLDDLR